MNKENWEEEILNSLHGLQRAKPDPKLYAQIRDRIFDGRRVLPRTYVLMTAACLALLLFANLQVLQRPQKQSSSQVSSYSLDNTNFNLYP